MDLLQLCAQKYGNDCRRRFACAETKIVTDVGGASAQQVGMCIHSLDNAGKHQ